PARGLVGSEALLAERLELGLERRPRRLAARGHDERERLHELVLVLRTHDPGLHHGWMLGERALDLRRRYPHATRLDHVIGASGVPEVPVGVAGVLVPGPHPLAFDGLFGALVLVPVARARTVPLDHQVAHLADRHLATGIVHDLRLVAGDERAARAGAHLAAAVRDEGVAHLGGAHAVQNRETELLEPALVYHPGERRSCRAADPDRPE